MSVPQTGSMSFLRPITSNLSNINYVNGATFLGNGYSDIFYNSVPQQQQQMSIGMWKYMPVQSKVGAYAEGLKINPLQEPINNMNIPSDINQYGQQLFKGGTAYDWASMGINTAFNIWNAYNQYENLQLAKQNFEYQKRLNHANYQMTAKAYNNNLRNQLSGRGYVGMSGAAVRELGRDYNQNKANKDY